MQFICSLLLKSLTNHKFSFLYVFLLASLDALAAACILERYLEEEGEGSIEAQSCPFPPPEEIAVFDYNVIRKFVKLKSKAEDHIDWHKVQTHVNNYKVR